MYNDNLRSNGPLQRFHTLLTKSEGGVNLWVSLTKDFNFFDDFPTKGGSQKYCFVKYLLTTPGWTIGQLDMVENGDCAGSHHH